MPNTDELLQQAANHMHQAHALILEAGEVPDGWREPLGRELMSLNNIILLDANKSDTP